ncbi:MAG: hypothetical protein MUQ00_13675 [Candidatus Aminicenantes bacterium]|nr:hypothetical protein [Candidatus Aminicenantes bacterium]
MAEKKDFGKLSLEYLRETFGDDSVRRVFRKKKVKSKLTLKTAKSRAKNKKPIIAA